MNAAIPAATARDTNSLPTEIHAGRSTLPSSRGIQPSHRSRTAGARCRNPSTHAKLSWKPAPAAVDGSCRIIAIAANATIASPFQSRPNDRAHAPMTAMSAERTALAAGAMITSATIAATPTGTARRRSSRMNTAAMAATTHPSTARLKPEIARMCEMPAARKLWSIASYPSSESPRTSATSIASIASPCGTLPSSR